MLDTATYFRILSWLRIQDCRFPPPPPRIWLINLVSAADWAGGISSNMSVYLAFVYPLLVFMRPSVGPGWHEISVKKCGWPWGVKTRQILPISSPPDSHVLFQVAH